MKMMKFLFFLLSFFVYSDQLMEESVYLNFYDSIKSFRQSQKKLPVKKVSKSLSVYYQEIVRKISGDQSIVDFEIYKVESGQSFFTSVPLDRIYISSHFFKEHLNTEDVLISFLLVERMRLKYKVFPKIIFRYIPPMDISFFLKKTQLSEKELIWVYQKSYDLLKNSTIDPDSLIFLLRSFEKHKSNFIEFGKPDQLRSVLSSLRKIDANKDIKTEYQQGNSRFFRQLEREFK